MSKQKMYRDIPTGFLPLPAPTNAQTVITDLLTSIATNDIVTFNTLIKSKFVYPHTSQKFWYERPLVEELFLENTAGFKKVVDEIALNYITNNSQNHVIFWDALIWEIINADLKGSDLFCWDAQTIRNIRTQLDDLQAYMRSNLSGNTKKRIAATDLFVELNSMLVFNPPVDPGVNVSKEDRLKLLQLKLNFLDRVHSKDEIFKTHRGWKKITSNIAGLLFAFIPNLINLLATGNFFFSKKTATQEKSAKLQDAIGVKTPVTFKI